MKNWCKGTAFIGIYQIFSVKFAPVLIFFVLSLFSESLFVTLHTKEIKLGRLSRINSKTANQVLIASRLSVLAHVWEAWAFAVSVRKMYLAVVLFLVSVSTLLFHNRHHWIQTKYEYYRTNLRWDSLRRRSLWGLCRRVRISLCREQTHRTLRD